MSKIHLGALAALLFVAFAACGKKEEPAPAPTPEATTPAPPPESVGVNVGEIEVGKAIGDDKKVTAPAETFTKNDTIYASIDTTGTGPATLKTTWTFERGGEVTVVNEESQTITPTGPETTEFHISKPTGWPSGDYKLEVFLDGKPVGMKKFKVG
ncbi:MAG TPA: hypothetical protein VFY29_13885 [Terriglobia bacterium]|nr:hypothetical protein [Terriglobia bacterium]